ncbi:MAG TPA: hypothetical protein VFB34_01545 [Chloroflexota bacterium]|nr:hypothetical protein [Chloroflexota bacterium]
MLELALEVTEIVRRLSVAPSPTARDQTAMRELLGKAREAAYDAGFPADLAWRAILRATVTATAPHEVPTGETWLEILDSLQEGQDQLSLVTGGAQINQ